MIRMPPSNTMPWMAFVADISGVCKVFGTLEMTSRPTKAASTRMVSSVIRSTWVLLLSGDAGGGLGALVNDLAVARDAGAGDDLVVEVEVERALAVDHQAEQRLDVLRVELRRVVGHRGREVLDADDLHVVADHGLGGLGELAVAAGLGSEVDDHGAGGHPLHGVLDDQQRRAASGDGGRRDDDVHLGDDVGERLALALLLLVGESPRVAAGVLSVLEADVELDELGAERADLLLDGGAHVEG